MSVAVFSLDGDAELKPMDSLDKAMAFVDPRRLIGSSMDKSGAANLQ